MKVKWKRLLNKNPFLKKMADLMEALTELYIAINDKGSVPEYHEEIRKRHRKEWPMLWKAIDKVIKTGEVVAGDVLK